MMSSNIAIDQQTYGSDNVEGVARVYDFLTAHEAAGRGKVAPRYFLAGARPEDHVELPGEIYEVLKKVADAMKHGYSVTVSPVSQKLTTQQAADMLNISRPTLVKILEAGDIPFERVGNHRKVALRDVLAFRAEHRRRQYEALDAMRDDIDETIPVEQTLAELKRIRKELGARRRVRGV